MRPYRLAHDGKSGRIDHRIGHIGRDRRFLAGLAVGIDVEAYGDLGPGWGCNKAMTGLVGRDRHRGGTDNHDVFEGLVLVIVAGAEIGQVDLGLGLGRLETHLELDGGHLAVGEQGLEAVVHRGIGRGVGRTRDKKPRPYR